MKTVAVIGCGKRGTDKEGWAIGHWHAKGYLHADAAVKLCGVDPNPENLAAFGAAFKLPANQLFASTAELYKATTPDVVSICTWPALHHPQVLEAVAAGVKGIICEKPMALDGSQIDDMLAACSKNNVKFAIAHQRCYEPEFIKAKELLQSGKLGDDLTIEARVGDGWDVLSWTVHWFDMAAWLFDSKPVSVLAGIEHNGNRRYQHAVEDSSVLHVAFDSGRQATFITGPDVAGGTMFCVRGTAGMMHIEGKTLKVWSKNGYEEIAIIQVPGFYGLMKELFAAIDQNAPIACDANRNADATRVAFAAHESARLQKRIKLPMTTKFAPLEILQHGPKRPPIAKHAVLVADAHHFDPSIGLSGRDGVVSAISALGVDKLTVIEAEKGELTPADLVDADLLLIYHTQRKTTPAAKEAVTAWVNAGKPLAIVHCGIGAYADWQQYREWCGLYWVWHDEVAPVKSGHPHEPCVIRIKDAALGLPWQEAWLPRDEVYTQLGQGNLVKVLATATMADGKEWPVAWQNTKMPNIAVFAPGHRYDIWQLPLMQEGLRATIDLVRSGALHGPLA